MNGCKCFLLHILMINDSCSVQNIAGINFYLSPPLFTFIFFLYLSLFRSPSNFTNENTLYLFTKQSYMSYELDFFYQYVLKSIDCKYYTNMNYVNLHHAEINSNKTMSSNFLICK